MARCFPYPPPGFFKSGDGVVNEVMKERLKIKDKKEKEEKKKDKKHKADEQNGMVKEKKHREHKKHKHEKVKELHKVVGGSIKEENEQMEKSCVTEEHEQPVCTQNLSDSFDSGQRGGKQKRAHGDLSRPCEPLTHKMQLTTCDTGGNHGKGSLKIKISMVRNSEQLQPCYQGSSTTPAGPAQVVEASAAPCRNVGTSGVDPQTSKRVSDAGTCDWEYGTGEWLPLLLPLPVEPLLPENLDWLFGENHSRYEAKKNVHGGPGDKDIPRVWSQASYLPLVNAYALPYVLPF